MTQCKQQHWAHDTRGGRLIPLDLKQVVYSWPTSVWKNVQRRRLSHVTIPHQLLDAGAVWLLSFGPPLVSRLSLPVDFWKYLYLLGGECTWDGTEDKHQDFNGWWECPSTIPSLASLMTLFNRKVAPYITGTDWVVCCTKSQEILHTDFYEQSKSTSSYMGKLLGLVAIYTFLLAICQFYKIESTTPKI